MEKLSWLVYKMGICGKTFAVACLCVHYCRSTRPRDTDLLALLVWKSNCSILRNPRHQWFLSIGGAFRYGLGLVSRGQTAFLILQTITPCARKAVWLFCTIRVFCPVRVWDVLYAYGISHTRTGWFCYPIRVWHWNCLTFELRKRCKNTTTGW